MTDRKGSWRSAAAVAAWAAAAAFLMIRFLGEHPPRPAFGSPGELGSFDPPWTEEGTALLGATALAAIALLSGAGIARLLHLRRPGWSGAIGLGFVAAWVSAFLLLTAGAFRTAFLLPLLLLPAAAFRRGVIPWPRAPRPPRSVAGWVLGALILAALATALVRALAPLTANDPMVYHMTLARAYAEGRSFAAAPDLVYARMPHAADLLYAIAYRFGGEPSARALYILLLGLNAGIAARIARRMRAGADGRAAALLFLSIPLVLDPRTVGNVDLAASLFFGLAALHLLRRRDGGGAGEWIAAALFAGSMLAVKYSSYAAYPLLPAILLLPVLPGARRRGLREVLLFVGLSHILVVPWMVKAAAETGNPLFPMFPAALGGEGWSPELGRRLIDWQRSIGMGRDARHWLLLPWNAVLHGQPVYRFFDGVLSPALLLWTPWALWRGGRTARWFLVIALAGVYLWGAGSQQLRFLLPVILLLAGIAGAHWRTEKGAAGTAQAALFAVVALLLIAPVARETARDALPVVTGRENRETYLSRKVQSYRAFREAERIVPPGERSLLVWENRGYYWRRPYGADSFFEASALAAAADEAGSPDRWLERLRREGYRWALVNRTLQNVFTRWSPPEGIRVMNAAWERCGRAGAWNGLELYRLPEARGVEHREENAPETDR
ncbi:MAG: hypothetical protein JW958_03435 [Candidatus Eisenbacteria bacterium]|nr:hypothetical protein [Candidatus Eisenbacteria bacterium]